MLRIKVGSTCAACVEYSGQNGFSWIITKVEKKSTGNKYVLRDEYAERPEFETYTVESNRITPFPAQNEDYRVGERVLALWWDEETNQWSTMLYQAEVKAVKNNGRLSLLYKGSDPPNIFDVELKQITKFPPDFDLHDSDFTEAEALDQLETPALSTTPPVGSDRTSGHGTDDEVPEAAPRPAPPSPSPSPRAAAAEQIAAIEARRVAFMFNIPQPAERSEITYLTNDDFTALAGPEREPELMRTEPGTPLLDALEDPELFSQEHYSHVTGSGVIRLPGSDAPAPQSRLLAGPMRCGRLGWILNEWRQPHK
jgi:hypothetical protein